MKENERWVLGGLSIISLYILPSLLSLSVLDTPAFIALVCLSVAIPLLAGVTVFLFYSNTGVLYKYVSSGKFQMSLLTVTTLAVVIDLAGIDAAIWHASPIAAWVFIGSVIFALAFFGSWFVWFIKNSNKPLEALQKDFETILAMAGKNDDFREKLIKGYTENIKNAEEFVKVYKEVSKLPHEESNKKEQRE